VCLFATGLKKGESRGQTIQQCHAKTEGKFYEQIFFFAVEWSPDRTTDYCETTFKESLLEQATLASNPNQ
jgi:hypothetical protein